MQVMAQVKYLIMAPMELMQYLQVMLQVMLQELFQPYQITTQTI